MRRHLDERRKRFVTRLASCATSRGRLLAWIAAFCGGGSAACTRTDMPHTAADAFAEERERMVEIQLAGRDIKDRRVLAAMRAVPRHLFVPPAWAADAYQDRPLPIGHGQTISQPYIVALMTELLRPAPRDRALEVGTGSGYQAAVLASLVAHVYTIEIVPALARDAEARLKQLDRDNVTVRAGDGYGGWPEHAPFDIIVVTAAPDRVPEPLLQQLRPGGRLVVPVGSRFGIQELLLLEKESSGAVRTTRVAPVRFVPLLREPPEN
jgi:protein-L-isoaspartate(D-aspartate) O-methyltransferase